ncbi:MAG TPA: bifunctional helix-turn-helix transcriptional regulator/GNAT family N-acetyltransferase [Caulobacteraceae bacterium]|jgi:DNA-binding MarR family transcriptional regulator/N-acetylglutamate synthase-like GNAT family acetyltransferase
MDPFTDRARRFNRFYTRAIGVLGEGCLDSGFSLAEARVIHELASREDPTARQIGQALEMDAGYLSRILTRLEAQGLVTRAPADDDRRRRRLTLTEAGREAFAGLDQGARNSMSALVAHLPPPALERLSNGMAEIEALLTPKPLAQAALRDRRPGDLGWIVERHARLYAQEYGWDARFETLVARIVAEMTAAPDPARERCWIAERDGQRLGSVFLAKDDAETARIRLLLVEPAARGAGLGRKLVEAAVAFARRAGYREVVLWTHRELHAARRIYADAGFRKTEEWQHHDFGPVSTGETWRLVLRRASLETIEADS